MAFDDNYRELSIDELENANTDRTSNPAVMVRGLAGRDAAGTWRYLAASASGYLMVSGSFGGSVTTSPLSADSSSISAIQGDAGKLRVSALGTFAATPQNDTVSNAQFSAAGNSHIVPVSSGQNTIAIFLSGFSTGQINFAASLDGTNYVPHDFINSQTHQIVNAAAADGLFFAGVAGFKQIRLSATSWSAGIVSATTEIATGTQSVHLESSLPEGTNYLGNVSAVQGAAGSLRVSAFSNDGGLMRVSAIGSTTSPLSADSSSISAKQADASNLMVSAKSGDAALFRVSALGVTATSSPLSADSSSVSAKQGDAGLLHVSSFWAQRLDATNDTVSAVNGDAGTLRISALNQDANFMHVSAVGTVTVSAHEVKQSDAASLRVSAIIDNGSVSARSGDANQVHVSAVQGDAGLLRVSADIFADTVGSLTVFRSLSLSASQAVKSSAGAIYGYYLWSSDTKPNYVKFFNTSGAINVGTDVPVLTVMLPPSAAANVEFSHGVKGFTAGIGIAALSAVADNATTAAAASAVGGNILYA